MQDEREARLQRGSCEDAKGYAGQGRAYGWGLRIGKVGSGPG